MIDSLVFFFRCMSWDSNAVIFTSIYFRIIKAWTNWVGETFSCGKYRIYRSLSLSQFSVIVYNFYENNNNFSTSQRIQSNTLNIYSFVNNICVLYRDDNQVLERYFCCFFFGRVILSLSNKSSLPSSSSNFILFHAEITIIEIKQKDLIQR